MAQNKNQPKILTANRLTNGETVYYTGNTWSLYAADAKVAATAEEAEELTKIGAAAYAANQVVDVNLIDVEATPEHKPARLREMIRATGPTVRQDLNKPVAPNAGSR